MELEQFRARARAWLDANHHEAPPDYGAIMPAALRVAGVAWQRRLHDEGWAGIHWPTEHGGQGLTPDHQSIWSEECARVGVPAFVNMVGFVLAGQAIQRFGTAEQRAEHLRPILTAERVWCQLFSEPEAGSDLASLRTTAEADGDGFVVNGHKVWCSAGAGAMLWSEEARRLTGAPGGRIAGGTSQIQRSIIGERILGLPREP